MSETLTLRKFVEENPITARTIGAQDELAALAAETARADREAEQGASWRRTLETVTNERDILRAELSRVNLVLQQAEQTSAGRLEQLVGLRGKDIPA